MHSIERYGIVALLFLVVTVVAVLMWDGGREKKKPDPASAAITPAASRERPGADERRAARRLSLAAEARPGPLVRQPDRQAGDPGTEAEPAADATSLTAPLDPGTLPGTTEERAPAAPRTKTPPEQPARDPVVGRAPAATHPYAVRPGDTLSEISQRELGSARRWPEIVAANPGLDPARLRAGKTIQIPGARKAGTEPAQAKLQTTPPKPQTAQAKPQAAQAGGARTWKVGKGESLWRIAESALGDGKRWPEIVALNPRVKPDRLVLGQVLTLPGATPARSAPTAAKPAARPPTLVASAGGERLPQRGGKVR